MKRTIPLALTLALAASCGAFAAEVSPQDYYGKIARRLGDMLQKYHVLQQKFNDDISQKAWTNLVTFYDFDHSVFLKPDMDELAKREKSIDDELRAGDPSFGFDVYNLYCRRLAERMEFATNFLATVEWDFATNETYRIKRKDAPWPETREAAEDHWRRRLKNEALVQILGAELDKSTNKVDAAESLVKKYRQYYTVLTEPDEETVLQHYLSAVARAYDPHSDYMSPASKEDFDMEMSLTLCGVGAVLHMDEGALKIVEIMPGGPVDRDGRIKEGDKIVGVQQEDGEMEDIMWKPIKKSIKKIRGPKNTRVTLEIVPRSDTSGATKKLIAASRTRSATSISLASTERWTSGRRTTGSAAARWTSRSISPSSTPRTSAGLFSIFAAMAAGRSARRFSSRRSSSRTAPSCRSRTCGTSAVYRFRTATQSRSASP